MTKAILRLRVSIATHDSGVSHDGYEFRCIKRPESWAGPAVTSEPVRVLWGLAVRGHLATVDAAHALESV